MAKKPRIVIEEGEQGVRLRVDHAYSPEHAVYMLAQAIQIIVTDGAEKEEVTPDELQELPTANGEKEEADVPNVSE
jgi:hypothetical protein